MTDQVTGGLNHKMGQLLFQSPIQVFGELTQGKERDRHTGLERERERGETHYQCQEQEIREDSRESNPNPLQKPTKHPPLSARTRTREHPRKKRRPGRPRKKVLASLCPRYTPITKLNPSSSNPSREQSKQDFFDLYSSFSCKDFVFLDCYQS